MFEYIKAFKLLSGRRSYGMGPNPISLRDIGDCIDLYHVEDFEEFIHIICEMDNEYLVKITEQQKKKQSDKQGSK